MGSYFKCVRCGMIYESSNEFLCSCGGPLEVIHDTASWSRSVVDSRLCPMDVPYCSGVWRFKELIHPSLDTRLIVTRPEGNTNIYKRRSLSDYTGISNLSLKHEGENPTGSFKDRGMTVAISEAIRLKVNSVACASTGNTSASMAAYAAQVGLKGLVFIPKGEIAYGKLSQAIAYGSQVIQVDGNFDNAMTLVQKASKELGLYLLNSLNPWRIEGQKSIVFELIQQRGWIPPDWIILPAGNLGNTSAFGKALRELVELGWIDKVPRLAAIQAELANPFFQLWSHKDEKLKPIKPETIASAIKIGNPVSWEKALNSIKGTDGVVEVVSDDEIMDAKSNVDRSGIGCEPASAASVAGARKLREKDVIKPTDDVVCILTGNLLKDPETTMNYYQGKLNRIKTKVTNPIHSLDGGSIDSLRRLLDSA